MYCFPGGKVEHNEDYLTATSREVFEETGYKIQFPKHHLIKVLHLNEYLTVTSIAPILSNSSYTRVEKPVVPYLEMEWLSYDEIMKMKQMDIVPGIKDIVHDSRYIFEADNRI